MEQEHLIQYLGKVHQVALKFYNLIELSENDSNRLTLNLRNIPETYTIIHESFNGNTELENHLENYFLKVINDSILY